MEAMRLGSRSGDRLFLYYCPVHLVQVALFSGRNLNSISSMCGHHRPLVERLKVLENKTAFELSYQMIALLCQDQPDVIQFYASQLPVDSRDNRHLSLFFSSIKLFYAVIMNDRSEADALARKVYKRLYICEKQFYEPERWFLIAMALVESQDLYCQRVVSQCLEKLEQWASISIENHLPKLLLVKAECQRLRENIDAAIELYDETIELANDKGFRHIEAIAAERATILMQLIGKQRTASRYLSQSYEMYQAWGAKAKLKQLEKTCGEMKEPGRKVVSYHSPSLFV